MEITEATITADMAQVAVLNVLHKGKATRSVVTKKLSKKYNGDQREAAIKGLIDNGQIIVTSFPTPLDGRAPTVYAITDSGTELLSEVKAGRIEMTVTV